MTTTSSSSFLRSSSYNAKRVFAVLQPSLTGLVIAGETAAVCPGTAGFDGDDLRRGRGEQFAVVADEEHRLSTGAQLGLQPSLAGHVEEVVGLVEQQHVIVAAQQRLERQPLLFTAAEGAERTTFELGKWFADRLGATRIPEDLGVVSAGVPPLCQRRRVAHRIVGSCRLSTGKPGRGILQTL